MAKSKKKTQSNLLIHSRAKVELLQTYLKRYLPIIQQSGHADRIFLMDLFCSEGVYDNGGKGSPIAILESIREHYDSDNGNVRSWTPYIVVFNDYKKEKVDKLMAHVEELSLNNLRNVTIQPRDKDYKDLSALLPGFMRKQKRDEFFIFIDPYGYKEINAGELKAMLDTNNSELLLFQPVTEQYRFLKKGTPASLSQFITDILGEKDLSDIGSEFDFVKAVKDGFKKYMGPGAFVDSFTIERDKSTVYALYFFSRHIRGFEKMLEAKWEMDGQEGKGWSYNQTFNMFNQDKEINPLETELISYLKTKRSNIDIYEHTLHFGYLPKHAAQVLKKLSENGLLKIESYGPKPVKKGAYYVTYEYKKRQDIRAFFTV